MKIHQLAIIALAGFTIGASGVEVHAHDWQAEKPKTLAYYDAYAKRFADNVQVQAKVLEVRVMAANIERTENLRNAGTKALIVMRQLDSQAERVAASNALSNLRLYYLYGNLLPRILNEFDDGLVEQGMSRPFSVRPIAISEKQFKSEQASLISQIGLSPDEIDPKPAK